ncbi:MAG: VCBS repeat-containing protein, partial [Planctomycetaceae bacterium]|nr:VCBS repeat-containing protein [Planctomycetaceae bacterium]
AGDVNGDGLADIITGAGPGAGPHVKVFDGRTGAELRSFFAYGPNFTGGVFVAAGDVNNDGRADIITGAGQGAPGGHVKVFDGRTGAELRSFFAFDPIFVGGVQVAAGDVNGDSFADIVTGAGPAGGGHVKVFDGLTGAEFRSFLAFEGASGGVSVAAGDITGDGRAELIVGAAVNGHVKAFDGVTNGVVASFLAYSGFPGSVNVAAGDVNGDGLADIITGAGPGAAGGHVKVFDGSTHAELKNFFAFDPNFTGGVFVAGGDLNSSAVVRRMDLELFVDTGLGDDLLLSDVVSFEVQTLRRIMRIDTGDGADFVRTRLLEPLEFLDEINFPRDLQSDLSIDMGDGHDRAEAELQPTGRTGTYNWAYMLRMGRGNDIARYWVFGTELPPAGPNEPPVSPLGRLDFAVHGDAGHDDIEGRVGMARDGELLPLALADLRLAIDGGAGDDRVSLDFRGAILDQSAVDVVMRGGEGHDQVRARFDLDPRSTGQLSAQVFGDDGHDELGLAVLNADNLDLLFALLDGGRGQDRCRTTPNVRVLNCP